MSKMIKIKEGLSINEYMIVIFREMCSRVGVDFVEVVLDETEKNELGHYEWPYEKYTWSEKQEDEFREWVIDYLYNNTAARHALTYCGKSKKCLRDAVGYILLMFGWRYEEKKEKD